MGRHLKIGPLVTGRHPWPPPSKAFQIDVEFEAASQRLADLVLFVMREEGLSQEELAARLVMPEHLLNDWLHGGKRMRFRTAVAALFHMGRHLKIDVSPNTERAAMLADIDACDEFD